MKRCALMMGLILSFILCASGGPRSPSIPSLGRPAPKPVYYDTFPARPHITISASWTIAVTNELSETFSTRAFAERLLEWTGIRTNEAPFLLKQNAVADRALAGEWRRGDGKELDLSLTLKDDGTYRATWNGRIGIYGMAKGKWDVRTDFIGERHIHFLPSQEDGLMKGHLRKIEVREAKAETVLVPMDARMREFFEKYGPSQFVCFQRRPHADR